MAIKGMFFNAIKNNGVYDRTYNASDFSSYLDGIISNGVFANPSSNLQVVASSGLDIVVKPGQGWIDGHKIINTQDRALHLSAAAAMSDRIDRVVFYCDYSSRQMGIKVLEGTPGASPEAPALTRNSTIYEMALADIAVGHGVTAITQADITDVRENTSLCGVVTGLIDQVDTEELFLQYQAAYNEYFDEIQREIGNFVQTLTEQLRINTYIVGFDKEATIAASVSEAQVLLDSPGYYYEAGDVIMVFINGLLANNDEYTLNTSGTTPYVSIPLLNNSYGPTDIKIKILKTRIALRLIDAQGNYIVTNDGNYIGG